MMKGIAMVQMMTVSCNYNYNLTKMNDMEDVILNDHDMLANKVLHIE